MTKNLSYFMRNRENEVVEVEAPETFRDENGEPVMMRIRKLSQKEIREINSKYKTNKVLKDKRGNPIVNSGEVVRDKEFDAETATKMLIVKALEYPNLADKELMDFYGCYDVTEMPERVFATYNEYNYVVNAILTTLGITDKDDEGYEAESAYSGKDVDDAKNSSDEQEH